MKKRFFKTVLFFLVLASMQVKAIENSQKYSLRQCLDFALNNSYSLHKAKLDISGADYQIQEGKSEVLPQINATGSMDHSLVLSTTMLPGEIIGQPGMQIPVQMGAKNVLDFGVHVEQVVFAPALFTGIKIARNNLELEKLRAIMTKEEIIFNVSNAYYDILNNMQELDNINYMISMQDSLYLLMKKRVDENVTREVDLNRIKVNLTNLKARGNNIKNAILQQTRYFQILIGAPLDDAFVLDDSEFKNLKIADNQMYSMPHNKIEIDIMNKQKEIIGLEIRKEKQNYLPTLSAIASGGYQFQSDNLNLSKEPWFSFALIGVRLSVPLFDGFGRRNRIRKKQLQLRSLEWDIRESKQTLSADYLNSINQLEVIYGLVQAQSDNLQLAEKVYTQTLALFSEGLATVTDILETETSLHEVKIAYATELIRYKKTEINFLKARGTLDDLLNNN